MTGSKQRLFEVAKPLPGKWPEDRNLARGRCLCLSGGRHSCGAVGTGPEQLLPGLTGLAGLPAPPSDGKQARCRMP